MQGLLARPSSTFYKSGRLFRACLSVVGTVHKIAIQLWLGWVGLGSTWVGFGFCDFRESLQ